MNNTSCQEDAIDFVQSTVGGNGFVLVVDKPLQARVRLIRSVNEHCVFSLLNFHHKVKVGDLSCSPRPSITQKKLLRFKMFFFHEKPSSSRSIGEFDSLDKKTLRI